MDLSVQPQPPVLPVVPSSKKPHVLRWIIIVMLVAIVVMVLLYATGGSIIGARLAPGLAFAITGPDEMVAGQTAVVSWNTSPANAQKYPHEKIEFCHGPFWGQQCVALANTTTNDGEATVQVPAMPATSGYLRLTARQATGGWLVQQLSSTRPIKIAATAAGKVIDLAKGGGTALKTLTPAGPRVTVTQKLSYLLLLPEPGTIKKIEICRTSGKRDACKPLASAVSGTSVQIKIPVMKTGQAYIRGTERNAAGQLTGRELFRRLVAVQAAPVEISQESGGGSGGGGGGGGSGGGGGGSSNNAESNNASAPTATPNIPTAEFVVPVQDETVVADSAMDVRVKLTQTSTNELSCQQWILDGVELTTNDWDGGQSPDLSAGPCN
jgi:hypothetical protein